MHTQSPAQSPSSRCRLPAPAAVALQEARAQVPYRSLPGMPLPACRRKLRTAPGTGSLALSFARAARLQAWFAQSCGHRQSELPGACCMTRGPEAHAPSAPTHVALGLVAPLEVLESRNTLFFPCSRCSWRSWLGQQLGQHTASSLIQNSKNGSRRQATCGNFGHRDLDAAVMQKTRGRPQSTPPAT